MIQNNSQEKAAANVQDGIVIVNKEARVRLPNKDIGLKKIESRVSERCAKIPPLPSTVLLFT